MALTLGCRTSNTPQKKLPGIKPWICEVCEARLFSSNIEDADGDSFDAPTKTFHHYGIHSHEATYLVVVDRVERTGRAKSEVKVSSVIVDVITGSAKKEERLEFFRVGDSASDTEWQYFQSMVGRQYYVFLNKTSTGELEVDSQDPAAMWLYHPGLAAVGRRHKTICHK
ncbi:MAG: hypothetical protein ACO1QB_03890 [Verrucomicrobiales bacterium]